MKVLIFAVLIFLIAYFELLTHFEQETAHHQEAIEEKRAVRTGRQEQQQEVTEWQKELCASIHVLQIPQCPLLRSL